MTLERQLEALVVRVAEEFKRSERLISKGQPGGYVGLDDQGKVPLENIDLSALNTPLATITNVIGDNRVLAGEPFTIQLETENFTTFDAILIDNEYTTVTFEDNIVTVTGVSTYNTGLFEIVLSRFGSNYSSDVYVRVVNEIWTDLRATNDFPVVINNTGDIHQTSDGTKFTHGDKTEWGEVLFVNQQWMRDDNRTLEVIVHLGNSSELYMFGIGSTDMSLTTGTAMHREAEVLIGSNGMIYGKASGRLSFPLNNKEGKYRFKFIDNGSLIEIYKVEDSDHTWSEGELVHTANINTHGTSDNLFFMLLVPTHTGNDRVVAYREY